MSKTSYKKLKRKQRQIKKPGNSPFWVKNCTSLIVAIILVIFLYHSIHAYRWLWEKHLLGNLKTIKKYSNLTIEQKWMLKLKFDYQYLNSVKKNTPENAIILMPPDSAIYPPGKKSDFNNKSAAGIKNKAWATYFLYPRKLVYEEEKKTNPFYNKANYVAIVNFWGYKKLNYKVRQKQKFSVLPLNLAEKSK